MLQPEGILNTISRLKADIERLQTLTGKTRKKGTAFLIREKQELLEHYEALYKKLEDEKIETK